MFKVIIAGSRSFRNYELLKHKCDEILKNKEDIVVVSGCASGADAFGVIYANERGFGIEKYPADWEKYGKSAGYRRNEIMAAKAEALIAFWDGQSKGTAHMIKLAQEKGLKVRVVRFGNPQNNKEDSTVSKEITFNDVKNMGFEFHDTLAKLAQGLYTAEELEARRLKGKAVNVTQAIAEMIAPENEWHGTYKVYSQRCFDQGNIEDPHEYTGVQIYVRLKSGISVTIDTHYGNIRSTYRDMTFTLGMGQKLMVELDKVGEALWADWTEPQTLSQKLESIEEPEDSNVAELDWKYHEARIWSRPTETRNYSKHESEFERDVRGGIKYTSREEDPRAGANFNYKMREDLKEIIAEQKRKSQELAKEEARRAQLRKIQAPKGGWMKRWEDLSDEEKEAARARYRAVAAHA